MEKAHFALDGYFSINSVITVQDVFHLYFIIICGFVFMFANEGFLQENRECVQQNANSTTMTFDPYLTMIQEVFALYLKKCNRSTCCFSKIEPQFICMVENPEKGYKIALVNMPAGFRQFHYFLMVYLNAWLII